MYLTYTSMIDFGCAFSDTAVLSAELRGLFKCHSPPFSDANPRAVKLLSMHCWRLLALTDVGHLYDKTLGPEQAHLSGQCVRD